MKLSMMSYTMWRGCKTPEEFDFRNMCALTRELDLDAVDVVTLSGRRPQEIRRLLDDHGLKAACYTFYADLSFDDVAGRQPGVDAVREGMEAATILGAPVAMIPTLFKRGVPREVTRRNYLRGLQESIAFARQAGVTLTVENFPGTASPFVISSDVLEAVREVPGLKVTFDNGNAATGGELPGVSFARCAAHVVHAHFKDWTIAPAGQGLEGLDGRWYQAALIGEGVVDQRGTLAAMKQAGYRGCINIEYEGNRYEPAEAVRRAVRYLRTLLAEILMRNDKEQTMNVPSSTPGRVLAGWAARDITPARPNVMHGQFHARISQGVADPLSVTALALEDPAAAEKAGQAIILSCDLVMVTAEIQDRVRQALRGRLPGFDPAKLFLSAIHTHSAPTLPEGRYPPQGQEVETPAEYSAFFVARAAEAAAEAWKNRRPAGVSSAYSHAVVGHNRRAAYLDGSAQMYGKTNVPNFDSFEGYEDHSLDLLFTWSAAGDLTGLLVNLACPSQVSEHSTHITADFWHETREELRKRYGRSLAILPQCAPAGDQSPHLLLHGDLEKAMWQRRGVTQRQDIARRIADAVDLVFAGAKANIQTGLPLRHHVETLKLPVRMVTAQEAAEARAAIAQIQADTQMEATRRFSHLSRNNEVLRRYETQKTSPHLPIELHVVRLGDVVLATNPFELFLDFGLRIKARSRAFQTFLVQLAADYCGYLPTAKAVAGQSYGAQAIDNPVGPAGGQVLVDRTVEIVNGLWA